ncbi:MAG: MFS transporter [Bryobacteraceae bacterium]
MLRTLRRNEWAAICAGALAMVATLPGRTQGLGLITEPLLASFPVSRVGFAEINLWATLIGSLACLPAGRLADRFGPRAVAAVLSALLGATVLAMGVATAVTVLAVTVTLTRGLGQSALSVASLALVGKRFESRLAVAMGMFALLVAVGFIAAFPTLGSAILSRGWRPAWSALGWALIVAAPVLWLLGRGANEDQAADGPAAGGLTLGEALRGPAFWTFAVASSLFGLVYSGIALFNQSILEQRGFEAGVYHQVLVISTMVGLVANFAGGWAATRWPIQRLMGIGMAILAAALVALPLVATYSHVAAYGVAMGAAGGIVTVVFFTVWRQAYGGEHLGRIQGAAQMMTVLASAVGPLLLARTLERTGSYDSIFYLLAAAVALAGVGSWLVALPARPVANGVERLAPALES